jgi:choline-sulfatase
MHLGIAALATAFVGLLFDASIVAVRSPLSGTALLVAAAGSGLLAFGALAIVSGTAAAIAGRVLSGERAARLAGRPILLCAELWSGGRDGADAPRSRPSDVWAWLSGKAAALAALAGATYFAMSQFHEPVRTALVAACVGLPVAFVADRGMKGAVRALATRLPEPAHPGWRQAIRRGSCGLLAAVLAAPIVYAVTARERLFGAVDPSPIAALALAAAAASIASALVFSRKERGGIGRVSRPRHVAVAGIVALVGGVLVLSTSGPARQAVSTGGALGQGLLPVLQSALDMDRDGSAWLLGGDCHPFDRRAHPLAVERPGNGYDENCDGSDLPVSQLWVPDPLDGLRPPESLVHKSGNVLIVLLDAESRDHLSLYGATHATTPNLDEFAKYCAVFDNFFAASNHTALSMPALLTGLPPSAFPGAAKKSFASVQLRGAQLKRSLQRRLGAAGYRTVMLAGHRMGGFTRGFDELEKPKRKERTPAAELERMLVDRLRGLTPWPEKPAFVVAHFMDAHHPYEAPVQPTRFGDSPTDKYDAELRYVDDNLGDVFDLLREEGFRDWLVVVLADHGEAFGQHGTRYHGESLYDEEIRVPLVVRVPGAKPRRIETPASHLDLLPTILEWTGAPRDPALQGRSLLGLIAAAQDPPKRRVVFTEFFRKGTQVSAHDGRWALSYNVDTGNYELYDGKADPGQKRNLYAEIDDPPLLRSLQGQAAATLERLDAAERPEPRPAKGKKPERKPAAAD